MLVVSMGMEGVDIRTGLGTLGGPEVSMGAELGATSAAGTGEDAGAGEGELATSSPL